MTAAVGGVGAIGSGASAVYALSPFLNGVVRTSDAAAAAQAQAAQSAQSAAATAAAIAARGIASQTIAAAPPFVNPALTAIADRVALGQTLTQAPALTPNAQPGPVAATPVAQTQPQVQTPSPTASVLYGDGGELIQAYGAVALLTGPVALGALYGLPQGPLVPAVAPVAASPRLARVENTA